MNREEQIDDDSPLTSTPENDWRNPLDKGIRRTNVQGRSVFELLHARGMRGAPRGSRIVPGSQEFDERCCMKISPAAGKPADPSILVNVAKLITDYYELRPDPGDPRQRAVFGTSAVLDPERQNRPYRDAQRHSPHVDTSARSREQTGLAQRDFQRNSDSAVSARCIQTGDSVSRFSPISITAYLGR